MSLLEVLLSVLGTTFLSWFWFRAGWQRGWDEAIRTYWKRMERMDD